MPTSALFHLFTCIVLIYNFDHLLYIHFGGCCPLMEFYPVQNSLCMQVLRTRILAALLHGTLAAGISQTLRRGTRNGIMELSQRAPPIFGWAAITLGIGPHSSIILHCTALRYITCRDSSNLLEAGRRQVRSQTPQTGSKLVRSLSRTC